MAKWGKKLLGLAAIGGAAAGLVYYLKSKKEVEDADASDDEEAPDAVEEADKAEEEHIGEAIAKEAEEADAESNEAAEECSGTETSEQEEI